MRRDPGRHVPSNRAFDPEAVRRIFDRAGIAAVYGFGSAAGGSSHPLSDVDLAYLGVDAAAEEQAFDSIYEALQRALGEGAFDLVPLRRAPLHVQFAIATEGRPLLVRDPIANEAFGTRAITRYLDFKHHRDHYFANPE